MITNESEFLAMARHRAAVREGAASLRANVPGCCEAGLVWEAELSTLAFAEATATRMMDEYDRRVNPDRKGQWMMNGRRRFWPEDPRPQDIDIRDIAHALSMLNRFNGRTQKPFSVAQHSVMVSRLLPPKLRLFGLLHDAAEGVLGDVISPVKRLIADRWDPIEDGVMRAVAGRFGFLDQYEDEGARAEVKRADLVMLATEIRDVSLFGFSPNPLPHPPLSDWLWLEWMSPERAEKFFLEEFDQLWPPNKAKSHPSSPCTAELKQSG